MENLDEFEDDFDDEFDDFDDDELLIQRPNKRKGPHINKYDKVFKEMVKDNLYTLDLFRTTMEKEIIFLRLGIHADPPLTYKELDDLFGDKYNLPRGRVYYLFAKAKKYALKVITDHEETIRQRYIDETNGELKRAQEKLIKLIVENVVHEITEN